MAKIRGIGHDHQAPFWVVLLLVVLLVVLVVVRGQAVTRGENKLPHGQYTLDPQYFYLFWTPYKMTSRGAD